MRDQDTYGLRSEVSCTLLRPLTLEESRKKKSAHLLQRENHEHVRSDPDLHLSPFLLLSCGVLGGFSSAPGMYIQPDNRMLLQCQNWRRPKDA